MEPRDLSTHVAYEAGRGHEEVARELGVDPEELAVLSSNENPLGPSPAAIEAVREHAGDVHRYPKAAHADLRAAIAREHDADPAQVWLSAGGDGGLDYVHRALLEPDDRILVPDPGFAYYGMSARYHHGGVDTYRLSKADGFAQSVETVMQAYDGQRVIYLISPHSPAGSEVSIETVREVAERTADRTLLLVDEAYVEYSDRPSKVALADERDDVAVLRTFSKAYGLAGLRVGYIYTPLDWADAYARVNTPFAVNELACRAALAALADDAHVTESVDVARWARAHLHEELAVRTFDSGANFVLAEVGDAAAVAEGCQRRGVVIRDCTSFGLPDCVRITCGTREETRRAVAVLNEVV